MRVFNNLSKTNNNNKNNNSFKAFKFQFHSIIETKLQVKINPQIFQENAQRKVSTSNTTITLTIDLKAAAISRLINQL